MDEDRTAKAHRLLTSGRVAVLEAHGFQVLAHVSGDHGAYVTAYAAGRWVCSCEGGLFGRCSHIAAVRLVTDPAESARQARAVRAASRAGGAGARR